MEALVSCPVHPLPETGQEIAEHIQGKPHILRLLVCQLPPQRFQPPQRRIQPGGLLFDQVGFLHRVSGERFAVGTEFDPALAVGQIPRRNRILQFDHIARTRFRNLPERNQMHPARTVSHGGFEPERRFQVRADQRAGECVGRKQVRGRGAEHRVPGIQQCLHILRAVLGVVKPGSQEIDIAPFIRVEVVHHHIESEIRRFQCGQIVPADHSGDEIAVAAAMPEPLRGIGGQFAAARIVPSADRPRLSHGNAEFEVGFIGPVIGQSRLVKPDLDRIILPQQFALAGIRAGILHFHQKNQPAFIVHQCGLSGKPLRVGHGSGAGKFRRGRNLHHRHPCRDRPQFRQLAGKLRDNADPFPLELRR